jgi:hypothetical protein
MIGWRIVGIALALSEASCTQPKSERCRLVCAKEAECMEGRLRDPDNSFDEKNCVAACSALEANASSVQFVAKHEACLAQAADCVAILACQ